MGISDLYAQSFTWIKSSIHARDYQDMFGRRERPWSRKGVFDKSIEGMRDDISHALLTRRRISKHLSLLAGKASEYDDIGSCCMNDLPEEIQY